MFVHPPPPAHALWGEGAPERVCPGVSKRQPARVKMPMPHIPDGSGMRGERLRKPGDGKMGPATDHIGNIGC